jgi:hypothetical protein
MWYKYIDFLFCIFAIQLFNLKQIGHATKER